MRVPENKIEKWAPERIEECTVSRKDRCNSAQYWLSYYNNGSSGNDAAIYNRCYSHIDRTSSFLYSPLDVRFNLEYDITIGKNYLERAEVAARFLTREFHRSGSDLQVSAGLETALIKGCSHIKQNWGSDGLEPYVIQPEAFGVLREDISNLDHQEAFVHTIYLTESQLWRNLWDHPDRKTIFEKVQKFANSKKNKGDLDGTYLQQLIIGGIHPIGTPSGGGSGYGSVATGGITEPRLAPSVFNALIRMDELWVFDESRDDYVTIQVVEPNIVIEGKYKLRNLCGVKGEHPFTKICPNDRQGYYFGDSELAPVRLLQDMLNRRVDEYDIMSELRANPPKVYTGFNGITDERNSAFNMPGSYITESQGNAKVDTLAPTIPADIFAGIDKIIEWFDDVAGFENVMKGQGEQGVRSGAHADSLMRSAGNRIRDRALLVERQLGNLGDFSFKMLQHKEAKIFYSKEQNFLQKIMGKEQPGEEFLLSQMPDDYRVQVDSHSSSPAFSEDARQIAYQLAKAGAIDATSVLELVHPPMADILIQRAKDKAEAEAKLVQDHPELLTKGKSKSHH